ncbi:uncharacterized protein LOC113647231 [Tachysurus fulvidraco]|uniref:uncharacterized protein LOC113647231 n=1 Tax=Tachysurus fulvidraco TaxID=1234273 RepID=UPI001FEE5C4F|nr:uncharacterized protein LOC113647231 [Tachysurus fulvidraco]XP_047660032.1 uncharacterized protein LOC113647231 [Tachysurus fulvidraco]XP_047660033.1 uncharacterized protein LOC113647231 [Tachysurus fulvidraco]
MSPRCCPHIRLNSCLIWASSWRVGRHPPISGRRSSRSMTSSSAMPVRLFRLAGALWLCRWSENVRCGSTYLVSPIVRSAASLGRQLSRVNWILSLHLCPLRDLFRFVSVTRVCMAALHHWRAAEFYVHGTPLGAIMMRKVVTIDASLTGWGATQEGRSVNSVWPISLRSAHINYLELLTVWKALMHFSPRLRGHHVLVRCDNTTAVAYINLQGGMRSSRLHALAHKLLVWSTRHFLSLWATRVSGLLNRGADLLSRGNPLYGEWRLHPQIVGLLWERFGQAAVDLFASRENAHCPMFFSLRDEDAPLGVDALAHPWPSALLYAFPPLCLISPTLARVAVQGLSLILIAPRWPKAPWLAEIFPLLYAEPWPLPLCTDLLTQANGEIFHPHPGRVALWAWPVRG